MYLRIVHWQMQPGKADELARRWNEQIASGIHEMGPLKHLYLASDPERNTVAVVSMWESRPRVEDLNRWTDVFAGQLADIVSGSPTVEHYDVLEEVS